MRQYVPPAHGVVARQTILDGAREECIRDHADVFIDWGHGGHEPRFTVFWYLPQCATGPHTQHTDIHPRTLNPIDWALSAASTDTCDDLPDPENDRVVRVAKLKEKIAAYEKYLDVCRQDRDWHGVMDAAADIREYEAMVLALTP